MTKSEIPDYYDQSKPKAKEEVLVERNCFICGTKAKMGRFQRYCSVQCRNRATGLDTTAHGIRFR
jgi:hypothetical protein